MRPTSPGWPRIASSLYYRDAGRMIDWLCDALDFELRLKVEGEGGRIEHSELTYGDGVIMVGSETTGAAAERFATNRLSPLSAGGNTRARAAGARIVAEPELHDYGDDYWADRSYGAIDPEGHLWWISQRIRG
jgi:uncharacterized glyoxalase superfamily protein PhnB